MVGGRLTLKGHLLAKFQRLQCTQAVVYDTVWYMDAKSQNDTGPQASMKCLYSLTPSPCHCHLQ